jgi:hypothetical protein
MSVSFRVNARTSRNKICDDNIESPIFADVFPMSVFVEGELFPQHEGRPRLGAKVASDS